MPASFPGNINTFVPSFEASGRLQIEYSRNPESFPLNRYVGIKTVTKGTGLYVEITAQEASRLVDQADYAWPDGGDAPSGIDGTESFEFKTFRTKRQSFAFRLGDKAVEQADWDILASHARIHAQKAMTSRTDRALTILLDVNSWGGNTDTATALSGAGGTWAAAGAPPNNFILKSLNTVKEQIHIATQGAVPPEALRLTMSPLLSHVIRESDEIIDYVKQTPQAQMSLQGREFYERWGVPKTLYGYKVVIEDTVKTTSRKGTTLNQGYAMDDNQAFVTAVVEGLENSKEPAEGAPTYNTMTLFILEDMTVESKRDDDNRRTDARVVDDYDQVLTANLSGFLITGTVS